ncbi:hypothetical protein [Inconstantimicrobium porci]|uniref:Uncharacterized protein n=1 Tax=Inconstantimicrobium porci TaxID=2652291 RepID=A0A7X2N0L9_9CLOT|nr:hypothetical protein [Inconstantimicrobium porci]MSR92546.1 hypothetical protein [Inconstantimicrobium porci]
MSNTELKNEFKDFIKDLTIEICGNVCLDKILQVNQEYEKNNTQLIASVDNMKDLIKTGKKDLSDIAVNNNKQLLQIIAAFNKSIEKRENEIEEIAEKNKKEYEKIFEKFYGVIKEADTSTKKFDENNKNLDNILKNVKSSNAIAQTTLNIVNKQNSQFFSDVKKTNGEIFTKYKNDVASFNEQQRQILINEMSEAIIKQKDVLSSEIIKDVNNFTNKITNEVMEKIKSCSDTIIEFIENDKNEEYYTDILNSIKTINNELYSVKNSINENENKLANNINFISNQYNKDIQEVKSNYDDLTIIVRKAISDMNNITEAITQMNISYNDLARRMKIWVGVFKYSTILICILIAGVICYEVFVRELIS